MSAQRYIFLFILVWAFGGMACRGQETNDAFLINSYMGLSDNRINDIFQDSRGYIWFATKGGLNRYDGYEYVIFQPENSDTLSLSSRIVNAVTEDHHGDLWIATSKGINRYDIGLNYFERINFIPSEPGEQLNFVVDLAFANDSILWCLMEFSLIRFNIYSRNFEEYLLPDDVRYSGVNQENTLYFDRYHNVLLLATSVGLKYFDTGSEEILQANIHNEGINTIYQDSKGTLWFGTELGLYKCQWRRGQNYPHDCEYVLENVSIEAISEFPIRRLIITTEREVKMLSVDTGKILAGSLVKLGNEEELPVINTILVDKTMNLWIGTRGGVVQSRLKMHNFHHYNTSSGNVALNNDMISGIYCDEDFLYLGSWRGGMDVINRKTQGSAYYSNQSNSHFFPEPVVNIIYRDQKGRLWVAAEGVYLFDPHRGSFTPIREIINIPGIENLKDSRIYQIIDYGQGLLAIAHRTGVYLINEEEGTFEDIRFLSVGDSRIQLWDVSSIMEHDGKLWIGMSAGVLVFDPFGKNHNLFRVNSGCGLEDMVLALKKDRLGHIWAGTSEGLCRFNVVDSSFKIYSIQSGFADDFINSIEEDSNGKLWIGTNKGISCFDPAKESIRNFGIQHGLSCMEFNLGSSFTGADGQMYFGGVNGVNFFFPDSVSRSNYNPEIVISGMKYFKRDYQKESHFVSSSYRIRDDETVQLFFSVLDYGDPRHKFFKYRISSAGSESPWHVIGHDNSIILSGLSYGKYYIEVLGSSIDGEWSALPAVLNLEVTAPIYRRKIFILIMLIPVGVLVFFIFEYRLKTLRKSNRALREKEIAAREVLHQKNLLSRRNKGIEDSLKYAQRIQLAMFTSEAEIKKIFPESFILQRPKDIVSGDFYWMKKVKNKIFVAVADCTGHGVPGAFMSLIGLEFFRQIIGGQNIYQPSLILNEINRNFDLIFDTDMDLNLRDGMDIALCAIDIETNTLEYAGAFNPLYIVREGEIIEIKADKIMLGPDLGFGERKSFTNHTIQLEPDDSLYMFSDGYADQFGGPEGKKFKFRRFRHLILSIYDQPMLIQQKILDNSITDWQGVYEQVDDILVMGLKPILA